LFNSPLHEAFTLQRNWNLSCAGLWLRITWMENFMVQFGCSIFLCNVS
jgi:hypothetical protein